VDSALRRSKRRGTQNTGNRCPRSIICLGKLGVGVGGSRALEWGTAAKGRGHRNAVSRDTPARLRCYQVRSRTITLVKSEGDEERHPLARPRCSCYQDKGREISARYKNPRPDDDVGKRPGSFCKATREPRPAWMLPSEGTGGDRDAPDPGVDSSKRLEPPRWLGPRPYYGLPRMPLPGTWVNKAVALSRSV
jgi:hypothetical protein